jgi:hypothetical protein
MATPLESRGWTFKERHLTSRALHFTAGEVYWECYHTNACETFPAGFAPEFVHGLDHQAYRLKTPISTASWESLVNMYSRRKLTFSSDKFVALSGMAQAMHFQHNDEYVAGMWRSKLEGQLCWSLGNNGQAKDGKETVPYRAPTWSWASVDGEIRFNVKNFDASKTIVTIKVLEVEIVQPGPDLFGAICFAKLLISCIMVVHGEVVFGKSYSGATIYWLEVEGSRIDFYPQLDRLDAHEGAISAVHMLPLLGWGGMEEIHGLMLDPTGQTQGEYQRTGYFILKAWEARKFETICMKQMRRMEDGSYSQGELYKTKGRIITLI